MWLNLPLLDLCWPLLLVLIGLWDNLIFQMPSFMATLRRRYICSNLLGMLILLILIMFVNSISPFMDWSRHPGLGLTGLPFNFCIWASLLLKLSPLFSYMPLMPLSSSYCFMWTILSTLAMTILRFPILSLLSKLLLSLRIWTFWIIFLVFRLQGQSMVLL